MREETGETMQSVLRTSQAFGVAISSDALQSGGRHDQPCGRCHLRATADVPNLRHDAEGSKHCFSQVPWVSNQITPHGSVK